MISGLVLKYLNGERFVICGFYKFTLPASTEFNLTVPGREYWNKIKNDPPLVPHSRALVETVLEQ